MVAAVDDCEADGCVDLSSTGKGFPGVEDQLDWHGKPLGAKTDEALAAVKALIKNPGPHGIKPPAFADDAPKVDLSAVKLSEPPNYKLGEKVRGVFLPVLSSRSLSAIHPLSACHTQDIW